MIARRRSAENHRTRGSTSRPGGSHTLDLFPDGRESEPARRVRALNGTNTTRVALDPVSSARRARGTARERPCRVTDHAWRQHSAPGGERRGCPRARMVAGADRGEKRGLERGGLPRRRRCGGCRQGSRGCGQCSRPRRHHAAGPALGSAQLLVAAGWVHRGPRPSWSAWTAGESTTPASESSGSPSWPRLAAWSHGRSSFRPILRW